MNAWYEAARAMRVDKFSESQVNQVSLDARQEKTLGGGKGMRHTYVRWAYARASGLCGARKRSMCVWWWLSSKKERRSEKEWCAEGSG